MNAKFTEPLKSCPLSENSRGPQLHVTGNYITQFQAPKVRQSKASCVSKF